MHHPNWVRISLWNIFMMTTIQDSYSKLKRYRIALKYSYVSCLMCFILVDITRKCVLRYAAVVWWHIAYFQALSTTLEHLKLIARGYCIGGETFLAFNQEAFTQQTSLSYYEYKCKKYGGTIFSTNRSSCLHLIL